MKNLIKQEAGSWFTLLAVLFGCCGATGAAAGGEIKVEGWRFDSAASPAQPEFVANATGSCQATVQPGPFASGWLETNSLFGTAGGVWDLGRAGTISCAGLAGLVGGPGQERFVTIKVKQYQDGSIYADPTEVSVPGAMIVSSNMTYSAAGSFGDWFIQEIRWRLAPETAADTVQVTSAYYGSLVDEISVETALTVLPPPQLSIRRSSGGTNQIEVSWSAAHSAMVLESNGNANDPLGWISVGEPVQTSGEVSSVTLEATGVARFYRLRQP